MKKTILRKIRAHRSQIAGLALAAILTLFPVDKGFSATYEVGAGKTSPNLEALRKNTQIRTGDEIVLFNNDFSLLGPLSLLSYTQDVLTIRSDSSTERTITYAGVKYNAPAVMNPDFPDQIQTPSQAPFLNLSNGTVKIGEHLVLMDFTNKYDGGVAKIGSNAVLQIDGTQIRSNSSDLFGGVVYSESGTLRSNNSMFESNKANTGGVYYAVQAGAGRQSTAALTNSQFLSNTAGTAGAVYIDGGNFQSDGSVFSGNSATTGNGGAVVLANSTGYLKNTDFIENSADGLGGAVYVAGSSTLNVYTEQGRTSRWDKNTDKDGANSIYFDLNNGSQQLTISGTGTTEMLDPIHAAKTTGETSRFTINKTDTGKWTLGGDNSLKGSGLTTSLTINGGTLELAKNAKIDLGTGSFTLKSGTVLTAKGGNSVTVSSVTPMEPTIILESSAKIEINMSELNNSDSADDSILKFSGNTTLLDNLTIDVTAVNAFKGDGTYNLVSLDGLNEAGFNVSNTKLLINGGAPSTITPDNDRVGTRTIEFSKNKDGLYDLITLTLKNVDQNRQVTWHGTTANNLWSETTENWNNTGNTSKYFLNGDDVVFDQSSETAAVQIDTAGVAVGTMNVLGQFVFTGGDVSGNKLLLSGSNSSATFDTRIWKVAIDAAAGTTGGLIAQDGETLTVTNAQSTSAVTAAGIFTLGQTSSTGIINFRGNTDSVNSGGAFDGNSIYLLGGSNSFIGNSAKENGGALATAMLNINGGSAQFENNIAGGFGGAIYVKGDAFLEAVNGDIVFRGNTQGADRTPNAIYMANDGGTQTLLLRTETGRSIIFYDPIESNTLLPNLNVDILGTGTAQFVNGTSNIHGMTTIYSGATMKLSNGAVYGAAANNPKFTLKSQGVLLVEFAGNKVQAAKIEFEKDSTIKVDTSTADKTGQKASLQLVGQTILPTNGTINIDAVGPSRDGTFLLVQSTTDLTGKITGKLNGQSATALAINDRYGKHEFIVNSGSVFLNQQGNDINRTINWTGTQSNVWSEVAGNWFVPEKLSQYFLNGDAVKFNDTATNKNITIDSNGVVVGGIKIESGDFSFNGGRITAIADESYRTLDKQGYGTLSLNQQNVFDQVRVFSGILDGGVARTETNSVIVGDLLIASTASLHPGINDVKTFRVDGNIQFQAGSYLYLDLGKTALTSDLLTASGTINFASDTEGTTTIVVSGKSIVKGEASTNAGVVHADGGLLLNGQALENSKTNVKDETVTIRRGGNKIVVRSDETLELRSASIIDNGHDLSIDALGSGRQLPMMRVFTSNQLLALGSIADAVNPSFANSLMAKFALTEADNKPQFLEGILPTINSAMPLVAQRGITQFRQINFGRLHSLNEMKSANYQRIIEGKPIRDRVQRLTTRGQRFSANAAPILWAQNYGDFLHQDKQAVQGFQSDSYGIALGSDKWIDPNTVVGIGFGGSFANVKTEDHSQWGDCDAFILSFYGSYRLSNAIKVLGSLGYAYNDYEIHRTPGGSPISSKHYGNIFFANLEISKTLRGSWTDITPFVNFDLVSLGEGGYDESNIYGTAVSKIARQETTSFLQTLGARFGRTRTNRFGWVASPSWWLGWIHDYGDGNISTLAQYTGGTPFRIQGATMNQDRFGFGLNYNAAVNRQFSFFGGYNGEIASRFDVHTIQAGLTFEF